MNIEELVQSDLHTIPVPADLVAPPDLADSVLHRRRRRHRNALVTAVAVLAVLAVGVPVALLSPPDRVDRGVTPAVSGSASPSSTPETYPFLRPGGGPRTILVYEMMSGSDPTSRTVHVLDRATGRYVQVPFTRVVPAPDGHLMAVLDRNGRLGVTDDRGVLDGTGLTWLDVRYATGVSWAPDGSALLASLLQQNHTGTDVARYDVATRQLTRTTLPVVGGIFSVGWADNSRDYVVLDHGDQKNPSGLVWYGPDGQPLGRRLKLDGFSFGGGAEAYPPSRRYVVVARPPSMTPQGEVSVVDLTAGRTALTLPSGTRHVGWYDDHTLVTMSPASSDMSLNLVDVPSGRVVRSVPMPGLSLVLTARLGPSAGLPAQDRTLGF